MVGLARALAAAFGLFVPIERPYSLEPRRAAASARKADIAARV